MKPKPKLATRPSAKLLPKQPPVPARPAAKVLQHPSSSKVSKTPLPEPKFKKKDAPEWSTIHGLTSTDFGDLIERRQTVYHKMKELQARLGTDKRHPEYAHSLNSQILKLMEKVSQESVKVDDRLVTRSPGHSPTTIDRQKLAIALAEHLDVDVIEEIIAAATEGGEPYFSLRVTEPKGTEEGTSE